MHNIKLVVAYDGTAYKGWQKTRMGRSIEETLQHTIEQILQHPAPLQAASRTDAGVHAEGQIVNFLTDKPHLDLNRFCHSLNSLLPKDIVILCAEEMPLNFHPTLDSFGKEYHYFICLGKTQLPRYRDYSWHVPGSLDIDSIRQVIPHFIGTHDFASFCNFKKNAHYTDTVRTIQNINLLDLPNHRILFSIQGNHFLYKMVRNIVGTLVDIGRKKISPESLLDIISFRNRTKAGVTAPAHGLFLHRVIYV